MSASDQVVLSSSFAALEVTKIEVVIFKHLCLVSRTSIKDNARILQFKL